jgi:hypothetical protein
MFFVERAPEPVLVIFARGLFKKPGSYRKFVGKPEIFIKTGFLVLWLRKSHRLSESVVVYSTGRVNKVARKNAVNCPGD